MLLAGCASPEEIPPTETVEPIDISTRFGLLAIDLADRRVTPLTEQSGPSWMSPTGAVVTWDEPQYAVILHENGTRTLGPLILWARVMDNATGIELIPDQARMREIGTGIQRYDQTLPESPIPGTGWTAASEDLTVLVGEYAAGRQGACLNDVFIRAAVNVRTIGCHVSVARDGRVGWTEGTGVRIMHTNGTIVNLTGQGRGDASAFSFVAHENPVFTADSQYYLRLTGGSQLRITEVIDGDGNAIVKLGGPRRLALEDVSEDGNRLLLRVFERT